MAAAAYAVRKNRERRQKQAQQREDNKKFIDDVMKTWDESKSGSLQLDDLQNWLTGINNNERVTEQEAKWVIWMCTKDEAMRSGDKEAGQSYKNLKRKNIKPGELPAALEHWMAYRDSKKTLDGLFERFDTDKSGWLNKEQVRPGGLPAQHQVRLEGFRHNARRLPGQSALGVIGTSRSRDWDTA